MKKLLALLSMLLLFTFTAPLFSADEVSDITTDEVASTEEVISTDEETDTEVETTNVEIEPTYVEVSNLIGAFSETKIDEASLEEEVDYELLRDTTVDAGRSNSGTQELTLNTSKARSSSSNQVISADQDITVINGKIVSMESGLIRTNGGEDHTVAMYASIDDFGNEDMAIPISGAGFDGIYLETLEVDGEYIIHYTMGGGDFYSSLSEVTLIPDDYIMARSHYEIIDGQWYKLAALDALTSDEYEYINLGEAPDWAENGVLYYTIDNENFYSDIEEMIYQYKVEIGLITDKTRATASTNGLTYSNYFQNLPFRSTSYYTSTDYKNYLKAQGKTASAYYSATSAFTNAQTKEKVNSLLLLAFADHESAYGTSAYSYNCYNFFGRFAYDSDPDQACKNTGLSSAYDGIMSQAVWIQANYFDVYDWRYNGTHAGDKTSGMNIKYASDENWGAKIGSHANSIDSYLGGSEQGLYKIIKVKENKTVYTTSSLSTAIKVLTSDGATKNYATGQQTKASNGTNYIVRSQGSGYYEIQLDTAKNLTSSSCAYTPANNGSYPKFDGYSYINVAKGVASYACDYSDWASQIGYINKSNVTELTSSSTVKPEDHAEDYDYGSCTELVSTTKDSSGNVIKYMTSSNNNKKCQLTYYGTSNVLKHRKDDYYTSGGTQLIKTEEFSYNSSGIKTNWKLYEYYANGKRSYHISAHYNTSGTRTYADEWYYRTDGTKHNWKKTEYYSGNIRKYHISAWYDSKGDKRTVANEWWYRSNGNKKQWKEYEYYSNGNRSFHTNVYYDTNVKRTVADEWTYRSNGTKSNWKKFEYYSNGNRSYHISAYYDSKGDKRTVANEWTYNNNGVKKTWKKYEYYASGKRSYHTSVKYDSSATRTVADEWWYRTDGTKETWKKYEYYASGKRSYHISVHYNSKEKRNSAYEYTYASNGQRTQRDEKTYSNGNLKKKLSYYYTTSGAYRYMTSTYY